VAHHINWRVVLGFGLGSAFSLLVFSSLAFVPPKWAVLMAVGLTPFIALSVPMRIAPNIEARGQAFLAGAIAARCSSSRASPGRSSMFFYVRTGMTRQMNVSTKAAAQVHGPPHQRSPISAPWLPIPVAAISSSGW
jgi:hypothetical protein